VVADHVSSQKLIRSWTSPFNALRGDQRERASRAVIIWIDFHFAMKPEDAGHKKEPTNEDSSGGG
jgi:hypothetical protein